MTSGLDVTRLDLPYFVYGTLRPRCGNARRWHGCGASAVHDGQTWVDGFKLIFRGVPYAIRADGEIVVGALILPPDEWEDRVYLRHALDSLEGHPDFYERIRTTAETPDGAIDAWIYSPTTHTPDGAPIPSGDFYQFREEEDRARDRVRADTSPSPQSSTGAG